jgi:hypothetical protein
MKTKKKSPTFGRTVMDPKPKNHDDKNRVDFRGSFDFTPHVRNFSSLRDVCGKEIIHLFNSTDDVFSNGRKIKVVRAPALTRRVGKRFTHCPRCYQCRLYIHPSKVPPLSRCLLLVPRLLQPCGLRLIELREWASSQQTP